MTKKILELPTQERLRKLFDYRDGYLYWRGRQLGEFATLRAWSVWNRRYAGKIAGSVNSGGFRVIPVDTQRYLAARLVMAYHGHELGQNRVVTINGVKDDTRLENLRTVAAEGKPSGVVGVCWHAQHQRWHAQGSRHGYPVHLGYFSTIEEAAAARQRFEQDEDTAHEYSPTKT